MNDQRVGAIGAGTRLICLLGHPVGHSRSPAIHNAAFASQGLDLTYLAFDVDPGDLPAAVAGLRALGVVGANVTVPHKERVLPLLDDVDPQALRTGAVNTIVNRGGLLLGYNTDIEGFVAALETGWGRGPAGARCLVVGAGGAARAVVAGLTSRRAVEIWVYNRTSARARDLCREAAAWSDVPVRPVAESDLARLGPQADLIVNATSVGLDGGVKGMPIPVDILRGGQTVMDITCAGEPTPLLVAASVRGAVGIDGCEMLVQQAARSYEMWTGRAAPVELMRTRVRAT